MLAYQYIAAYLNHEADAASTPEVDAAMSRAVTFFNSYTPDQVAARNFNRPARSQAIADANLLDRYNNGLIGPGHCS